LTNNLLLIWPFWIHQEWQAPETPTRPFFLGQLLSSFLIGVVCLLFSGFQISEGHLLFPTMALSAAPAAVNVSSSVLLQSKGES
jgi:hypothetical protein